MLSSTLQNYLKANLVLQGVWDTIVKESPMIARLLFEEVTNDVLQYNVELTMPSVSWLDIEDQITESTGTFEQRTTNVYALIGDADSSKKKKKMNPLQDPEAVDIEAKAKAMAHAFELAFILGQTSTSQISKEFKGIMRILAEFESATTTDFDAPNNSQVIAVNVASGGVTMTYMDTLLDQVRPGKADMILASRRARRKLNTLARTAGTSGLQMIELPEFGLHVPSYDGVPLFISDWVPDNLQDGASSILDIAAFDQSVTRAAGYDNTMIFAMKIGENDLHGVQAGGIDHERETFVENKDVIRNRFKWYVSAMCKKKFSLAALFNINPDI